jgi:hypothetical protein
MKKEFWPDDDEVRSTLEEFHRTGLDKETVDKIKALLLAAQGFTYNLKLIEAYWDFLKKRILVNYYCETPGSYKEETATFLRSKSKRWKILLQRYIPEKFYSIKPVFT